MAVISKPSSTFTEVQTYIANGSCFGVKCARCGGLMVLEEFEDFELGSSADGFLGQRCVNCGTIVDPVIVTHQGLVSSRATANQSFTRAQRSGNKRHGDAIRSRNTSEKEISHASSRGGSPLNGFFQGWPR